MRDLLKGALDSLSRMFRAPQPAGRVNLREGADYAIELDERRVRVARKDGEDAHELPWDGLSEIVLLAIDGMPAGRISWILHAGDEVLEAPCDAEGSDALLERLQALPGFDNRAVIDAMGMTHGWRRVWAKGDRVE